MQFSQANDTYIIYLLKNEKIMHTLTQFCKDHSINNAQISGIGAVKDIEIGAYDLNSKEYITHKFIDIWELTSFQANVMLKDGNPFVHSHINISDRECNSKGGHLFEATVAVVGEFILRKINLNQKRKLDPNIGLACMSLNN